MMVYVNGRKPSARRSVESRRRRKYRHEALGKGFPSLDLRGAEAALHTRQVPLRCVLCFRIKKAPVHGKENRVLVELLVCLLATFATIGCRKGKPHDGLDGV